MRMFLVIVSCSCAILFAGCASRPRPSDAGARAAYADFDPSLLSQSFSGYEEVLKFLAVREGLPHDRHSLFEIAADSELERNFPSQIGELVLVRLDYRGESRFGIRGAQGQGRDYAFKVTNESWQLVGIFHGNYLRWEFIGDTVRAFPHWHTSAFDDPADDPAFIWNGWFFEHESRPDKSAATNRP